MFFKSSYQGTTSTSYIPSMLDPVFAATLVFCKEKRQKEKEKIQNALTSKFGGKKLILTYIVDESLLGGFIAEIDGYVVDSTLKTKLGGLKDVLSKNTSHQEVL